MAQLAERHAVVTGGSRGIGRAVARSLGGAGAALTLVARDAAALDDAAAELRGAGCEVETLAQDVLDREAWARALRRIGEGALGAVDVLVNCAGGTVSAPVERVALDEWDRSLELNVTAAFVAIQQVLPGMRARGFGRIVNVASTAGLTGYAYVAAYCAAKHALVGLTRAVAQELLQRGGGDGSLDVTCNAVCPGFTDTDMTAASAARIAETTGRSVEEARAALASTNPLGRLVRPEEVASAVAWLCGPGQSAIQGAALAVAGGERTG